MAILDFFIKRDDNNTQTPTDTKSAEDLLLQALMDNDEITREQAMSIPEVSGAVDLISNMIASMPVKLYKYKNDRVEEKKNDIRVSFLNGDTGDTLDAFQMKKAMIEDYLMGKGAYCKIDKRRNEVTGLYYVKDTSISISKNNDPIHKEVRIGINGKPYHLYDFIVVLRNTKDGGSGNGLTKEVGKALETAYNTLLYQLNMVKSGGNKRGFIKAKNKLSQEEINILKRAWKRLYANNTENVVVLNNGLEFQDASNSAVETQLNESKQTLKNQINSIFHINEDDFYDTFKKAIYPIIRAFETALNRHLLLEREKDKLFFAFDTREIIKANVKERYDALKIAKDMGLMTINEMRTSENMNSIDGMDVINVGLGAVLYDINGGYYYTPNTDTKTSVESKEEETEEDIDKPVLEGGEEYAGQD